MFKLVPMYFLDLRNMETMKINNQKHKRHTGLFTLNFHQFLGYEE